MNIEAFNTDTLRKLVRNLQDENKKLKEKLDEANIPYEEINLFEQPIDGMIIYALNNKIRKYSVMNVSIKNGRD